MSENEPPSSPSEIFSTWDDILGGFYSDRKDSRNK